MSNQATIYYDGMTFKTASELESYIKLQAFIEGVSRTQSEVNLIVQTAIEESLDEDFDIEDDRLVSLEEMSESENSNDEYFESYDLYDESELDFN